MKCFHYTISTVFLAASLLLTACEENTFQACEDEVPAYIRVSTAPMTLVGSVASARIRKFHLFADGAGLRCEGRCFGKISGKGWSAETL